MKRNTTKIIYRFLNPDVNDPAIIFSFDDESLDTILKIIEKTEFEIDQHVVDNVLKFASSYEALPSKNLDVVEMIKN